MGTLMTRYLASQIEQGNLKYNDVVKKRPDVKEELDNYLKEDNMMHLIETEK